MVIYTQTLCFSVPGSVTWSNFQLRGCNLESGKMLTIPIRYWFILVDYSLPLATHESVYSIRLIAIFKRQCFNEFWLWLEFWQNQIWWLFCRHLDVSFKQSFSMLMFRRLQLYLFWEKWMSQLNLYCHQQDIISIWLWLITSAERRRLCFHLCWFVCLFLCL